MDVARAETTNETIASQDFDWQNCWYPVSFLCDLARDQPTGFSLYDMPLVLFFDQFDALICLLDRCPHRGAKLSDGQIIDGRLECLYHGWQYGAGGDCLHIPQLLPDKPMPMRSCARAFPVAIRQDIVWVWAGEADKADHDLLPLRPVPEGGDIHAVTFQMDLPYDQSYLIENVIDVAHIHIAHDGVRGGGIREAAKPLDFDILNSSIEGISSTFRSVGLEQGEDGSGLSGALVEYVAPNLIRYSSQYSEPGLIAGLELFSLPLGKGRCRLLYRKYSNFNSWREKIKPRWLEHMTQILILEQDMGVVVGQHEAIEKDGKPLRDQWLPLRSSDRLVIEYRKWLDRYGGALPFYRGFATAKNSAPDQGHSAMPRDRHSLHTHICATCSRLYRRSGQAISILWAVVAGTGALAVLNAGKPLASGFVVLALLALATIVGLRRLRSQL